jgi:hypothetical protein
LINKEREAPSIDEGDFSKLDESKSSDAMIGSSRYGNTRRRETTIAVFPTVSIPVELIIAQKVRSKRENSSLCQMFSSNT